MNRIERKSLLIALTVTLILTGLLLYYLQAKSLNSGPMVKVVVAAVNIQAKTAITNLQVKETLMPQQYITSGSLSSVDQALGKIAKDNIYEGEQVTINRLVQNKERDGLAVTIPDGFRAITIQTDQVSSVGGNIKSGDYVDILVYIKPPYSLEEETKTVFQDIQVLLAGTDTKDSGNSSGNSYLYTLCMTPQDAEKLYFADTSCDIRLVLRQPSDKNQIILPGTKAQSIN